MASIFRKDDQYVEKQNRNVFYKTFESNLTTNFGKIIPAFCKPVMIGETVKLDPKMSFNFLPLVFPVQNRVRAVLQFYYVRNRNLWDGWKDFQFKMKDGLVPPYHVFREETYKEMLKVGGLLDNLGVPVVLHGNYNVRMAIPEDKHPGYDHWFYDAITGVWIKKANYQTYNDTGVEPDMSGSQFSYYDWYSVMKSNTAGQASLHIKLFDKPVKVDDEGRFNFFLEGIGGMEPTIYLIVNRRAKGEIVVDRSTTDSQLENTRKANVPASRRIGGNTGQSVGNRVSTSSSVTYDSDMVIETGVYKMYNSVPEWDSLNSIRLSADVYEVLGYFYGDDQGLAYEIQPQINVEYQYGEQGVPLSSLALTELPFPYYDGNQIIDSDDRLHISSMPARAIQSVYNAFVRNETNNPFMINGQPEYNKYISNESGGPDGDFYPLYKRNWQDDCFTTALHSPQHGVAPLVGLRTNAEGNNRVLVLFDNEDGTRVPINMTTDANDDVIAVESAVQDEYANTLANALMEGMTNFGMSINDFRNGNSYQRWLENNVRKGYKYPDQIKAHTGVSVKYNILDMPEYIGGMSRDMQVQQVTQTTENDYGNLGDFSGQAWINGEMEHSIEHFCDEEGFIIGLLSIDPVAPYSQVIPKYLLRESAFDYYASEFSKIGMQPILNREIAPLQSFYEKNGLQVFGYQRAWYDMLDGLSEVHGKFRTDFRNFIISRTFGSVPELSEDFLTMDVDDINNIFYVDDEEDKILGQILFKYESLQPIPVYGIPALE